MRSTYTEQLLHISDGRMVVVISVERTVVYFYTTVVYFYIKHAAMFCRVTFPPATTLLYTRGEKILILFPIQCWLASLTLWRK